jgi:hypothetical protein
MNKEIRKLIIMLSWETLEGWLVILSFFFCKRWVWKGEKNL